MHLKFRNVNDAFAELIQAIEKREIEVIETPSRNGPVMQIPEPIIITYTHPRERVLFNQARDCNPFFHLFESLWMLAGRNDVAPLQYYASKIGDFSDDGKTFNGAYGYRWRHAWTGSETVQASGEVDQLSIIIDHLKEKPESRRVVLQMWNVVDDLLKIGINETTTEANKSFKTFSPASKDVCCNTAVYFSIRTSDELNDRYGNFESARDNEFKDQYVKYLDMTVTNRSNDIIWGMFGANAVHFSFLQEYIACALGIEVGHYHQMSNNAHIYTETNSGWHPTEWLREYRIRTMHSPPIWSYGKGPNDASGNVGTSQSLFNGEEDRILFDSELNSFVTEHCGESPVKQVKPFNSFLRNTAHPVCAAFYYYKQKDFTSALEWCDQISGGDWRLACTNWIQKRGAKYNAKKV